jgi:hypothetical protein
VFGDVFHEVNRVDIAFVNEVLGQCHVLGLICYSAGVMAAPQALGACSRDGGLFVPPLRHMVVGRGASVKQFLGDKSKETQNFFDFP